MSSIVPPQQQPTSPPPGHPHHIPQYLLDCERYLGRIASISLHTLFFLLLIRFFILEPGVTDGISMNPTLDDNSLFIIEKATRLIIPYARYDIIQFIDPDDKTKLLVKRVVGLPGETLVFKNNAVYKKSTGGTQEKLLETYLGPTVVTAMPYGAPTEMTLPAYSYLVLGDNRQYSRDSRAFGAVHRNLITGKVYPISLH